MSRAPEVIVRRPSQGKVFFIKIGVPYKILGWVSRVVDKVCHS